MKIVIIGGGSAGTTCAFELRKLNKEFDITILESSKETQYSPCALPYVISDEIKDFNEIYIFKKEDYVRNNINLFLNSKVIKIDRDNKILFYEKDNEEKKIDYDKLVIATGSSCFIPPIKNLETVDYFVLKTMSDAKRIVKNIKKGDKSVVVGAGLIGVELAISLAQKGERVILINSRDRLMPYLLDKDMSDELKTLFEKYKIEVYYNERLKEIENKKLILSSKKIPFDKLFLCAGIRSNMELAQDANLEIDKGIIVNEYLQTSDKNIFACGDCVESVEVYSKEKILCQLGTIAVRQAKTIAKNIDGEKSEFSEVLNNTITKVGDLFVACVGLNVNQAKKYNIKTVSAKYTGNVRSEYFPSKSKITIKLICDFKGIIIGCQIVGNDEVVGRIDLIALAIQKKCSVKELMNLETCYNPPSAPIFDPITIVAEICFKKLNFMKR